MLSVGSSFGRGFDSHRLHHLFSFLNSFFLAARKLRFCRGFWGKWVFFDGVFVVNSWSICGDFVVPEATLFGLEKYATFSKYFSL